MVHYDMRAKTKNETMQVIKYILHTKNNAGMDMNDLKKKADNKKQRFKLSFLLLKGPHP
jgi:hypothetical protein